MKNILVLFVACITAIPIMAQEPVAAPEPMPAPATTEVPDLPAVPEVPELTEAPEVPAADASKADTVNVLDRVEVIESPGKTRITLGQNEVLIVEDGGDTTKVKLGSKGISIVEGEGGTQVKIVDMEDQEPGHEKTSTKNKKKKFKPHYAGVELGLNNYVTPSFSMNLPSDETFMDLNTGRSWNVNLNILEYGIGLGTDKVGFVTGLGFEWTNYVFDRQNSISKDENGMIVEYVPIEADNITRSKMNMTYLTAPLLLEFQIPAGRKRIHLSGGLIGGIKIASNTKIKYEISGQKSKEKAKGDFNLAPLRYGASVRLGYRALNLFANYYFTPLFSENGGPELYPFSIGLSLIPF